MNCWTGSHINVSCQTDVTIVLSIREGTERILACNEYWLTVGSRYMLIYVYRVMISDSVDDRCSDYLTLLLSPLLSLLPYFSDICIPYISVLSRKK